MTTYPAYKHGLTIELRDGQWCVTNDFGGRVVYHCIDEDDAVQMRDRYAVGASADALAFVAAVDATKNRIRAAKQAIEAATGEYPFRVSAHDDTLIRYGLTVAGQPHWGEAYSDEASAHAVALERLLSSVSADILGMSRSAA